VLLLGGRSWKVTSVDWSKRTVAVEPTDDKGKSRWLGTSRWLGFEVCRAIRRVLLREGDAELGLSRRGTLQLEEVRELITAPERQGSLLIEHLPSGRVRWWTFAGGAVNSALALRLGDICSTRVDDLWVETGACISVPRLMSRPLESATLERFSRSMADRYELKFSACLGADLLNAVIAVRSLDEANLDYLATIPFRVPSTEGGSAP